MAPAIRFRDAVVLAGRFPLLAGIDFTVAEGEVVLLRGPNGAGKTSLLRAAAGLVPIASGEAVVLGFDLQVDRREVRQHVGLLGHTSYLYDELTVADNLRFAVRAARGPEAAIGPALHRLGLDERLSKVAVARLSAGQRRRVAIAALLARGPRLWLLDEPHAGLDEETRDVLDEIVGEAKASGSTVVLASHELDRAARIADRVVAVAGGRIVEPAPTTAEVGAPGPDGPGVETAAGAGMAVSRAV
jgi:heme ABC exporter ATP-binding subunit CcmA